MKFKKFKPFTDVHEVVLKSQDIQNSLFSLEDYKNLGVSVIVKDTVDKVSENKSKINSKSNSKSNSLKGTNAGLKDLGDSEYSNINKETLICINLKEFKKVLIKNVDLYCNNYCNNSSCNKCILTKFKALIIHTSPLDLYNSIYTSNVVVTTEGVSHKLNPAILEAVQITEELGAISILPKDSLMSLYDTNIKTLLDE